MPRRKPTGKPGGRPDEFTEEQIKIALIDAQGWMGLTAKRLGCSYNTVINYMQKYPALQELRDDLKHVQDDHCSVKLAENINAGNMTAIIWYEKTRKGMTDQPQPNPEQTKMKPRQIRIVTVDASKPKVSKVKK